MPSNPPEIGRHHRLAGSIALLVVVMALIGNVVAFAWLRPYGILRELSVLAQAREQIHARYVGEVDDQALIDAALAGMADTLGDPNTQYLSAKDLAYFNEHVGGEFTGIGAEIDIHENRLRIVRPLDDSPAWDSGVKPGDIVLQIDGQDTLGIDINEAMTKLKGMAGTTVAIKIQHLDGSIHDLTITRAKIEVASVQGFRHDPGNGDFYMIDPQQKIAYVRLTQFGEKSYEEIYRRLTTLSNEGMQALILDLRDNGGGLLDAAVDISDMFLTANKTIVSTQGKDDQAIVAKSSGQTLLPDLPLVVLVNEYSASASEIVAGALRDNQRALIVGTRTYGKGSVQQLLPLDDGNSALKLTTAYWYIPSGRMIHRLPDAKEWGVDPSPGCYVPMDDERLLAMLLKRRDSDLNDPYAKLTGPVSPQWIRETLLDDQLAAALEAAQGKLASGNWPKVGVTAEEALTEPSEHERLTQRKQELMDSIKQIDQQLQSLEQADPQTQLQPAAQP